MATMLAGGTSARMLWTCWKTKPPPGCQIFTCWRTCSLTCAGVPLDQHVAGVAAAAPEGELAAEVAFEAGGLHAAAGDLHRVDGVQPGVNQAGQQFAHAAAAVQHDLQVRRALLDQPATSPARAAGRTRDTWRATLAGRTACPGRRRTGSRQWNLPPRLGSRSRLRRCISISLSRKRWARSGSPASSMKKLSLR